MRVIYDPYSDAVWLPAFFREGHIRRGYRLRIQPVNAAY